MLYQHKYIINKSSLETQPPEFSCYFMFQNIEVFTQKDQLVFNCYQEITNTTLIQSVSSSAAELRPKLISLLDAISFLVGSPITVYDINSQSSNTTNKKKFHSSVESFFRIETFDNTIILNKIISSLDAHTFLIASALDKWNKANYLLNADDASVLCLDEAILNYMHIFELISNTVRKSYNDEINNTLEQLLTDFFSKTSFYTNNAVETKVKEKLKITREILVGTELHFSDKIKFFLNQHGLLDESTAFLVDNLIKLRNSIAHGRMVSTMDIMEYPLTPFYNVSGKVKDLVIPLKTLSALCISKYVGVDKWHDEWVEIKKYLQPSNYRMKKYIENEHTNVNVNSDDVSNINWYSLFIFYINSNEKIKLKIEDKVKAELKNIPFKELLIPEIFELSIVLCDTQDVELFNILKKIIKYAVDTRTYPRFNYRDTFIYLEYRNYDTTRIRDIVQTILN